MRMDGLESCMQSKQAYIMPLDSSATVQQNVNIPIVYSDIDGLALKSEGGNGYDLEQWNNVIQCGVVQEKNATMRFSSHHITVKESTVTADANQSQDMGLAKCMDTLSGCSEKTKDANRNCNLKPSWKKPPRPPRRTGNASRERHMKGISDTSLQRKARLGRMKSARSHKFAKPSLDKTSFWALFVTFSFVVIMITQGIFSQGTSSLQDLSPRSGQASPLSMHNFASRASNNESNQASSIGQTASAFSLLTSRKMQNKGYPVR